MHGVDTPLERHTAGTSLLLLLLLLQCRLRLIPYGRRGRAQATGEDDDMVVELASYALQIPS